MAPECIQVDLGDRSYSIEVDAGLLDSGRASAVIAEIAAGGRICIVTHPKLRAAYAEPIAAGLKVIGQPAGIVTIPVGERHKNLSMVGRLYAEWIAARLDRAGLVVAVGGGVLGDMVGFAAATYLRGIRFVQVPTTLLAQVDASVGGKTAVDLPQGKNLIGAFHQPSAVLIDTCTLLTLPMRELRAGLAEVLKYGIIYDGGFFRVTTRDIPLLLRRDRAALTRVIVRSCDIKAQVVTQDQTEQGLRAILNFGHTIGHALETVTGYRRYRHGEAVSIGMVSAALIGEEIRITPHDVTDELTSALRMARLPVAFPTDVDVAAILAAAQHDKKTRAGKLHFILARGMGQVISSDAVTHEAVRAALARQQQYRPHEAHVMLPIVRCHPEVLADTAAPAGQVQQRLAAAIGLSGAPMPEVEEPDVVPGYVREIMILAWLLLFGGRWLLVPVLQVLGIVAPQEVASWDENLLLKLYLIMLAFTLIILALRAVRAAQSGTRVHNNRASAPNSSSGPEPSSTTARGDLSLD